MADDSEHFEGSRWKVVNPADPVAEHRYALSSYTEDDEELVSEAYDEDEPDGPTGPSGPDEPTGPTGPSGP